MFTLHFCLAKWWLVVYTTLYHALLASALLPESWADTDKPLEDGLDLAQGLFSLASILGRFSPGSVPIYRLLGFCFFSAFQAFLDSILVPSSGQYSSGRHGVTNSFTLLLREMQSSIL